MRSRFNPWIFLIAAVVLAVAWTVYTGFEYIEEHPHNTFAHVADSFIWDITEGRPPIELPHLPGHGEGSTFPIGISKFAILELVAALLILAIFIPLCRRLSRGQPPRGAWDNAFEGILVFIRNDVAKPNLGEHEADKYVPFLWTVFLFVLFNNLLGMLPWMGSPTANLYVTGALAVCAFIAMHGAASVKMGPLQYLKSQWPHVEVVPNPWRGPSEHAHGQGHGGHEAADPADKPAHKPTTTQVLAWIGGSIFGFILSLMIFVIELISTVIKSSVLAVRLFANMFAGHTVLAMILSFIILAANTVPLLWSGITVASVLGVTALSLLELFVAFLQAYIFVFLTALFMGMALNPAH
jgi:F-type H+-transporting ATPase subunit a